MISRVVLGMMVFLVGVQSPAALRSEWKGQSPTSVDSDHFSLQEVCYQWSQARQGKVDPSTAEIEEIASNFGLFAGDVAAWFMTQAKIARPFASPAALRILSQHESLALSEACAR